MKVLTLLKNLKNNMVYNKTFVFLSALLGLGIFCSCGPNVPDNLPYIGQIEVVQGDSLYHKIPAFQFVDQDSQNITNATFKDKIYVADFFFTSCPSICPKVKKNMLRIYDLFKDNSRVELISHSIDVKRDTVGHLKIYASNLGVESDKWHFVTGNEEHIFAMADEYFVSALADPNAPGGFDHSGRIILVDTHGHVRSYCNGTDSDEVDRFMLDIKRLLNEEFPN